MIIDLANDEFKNILNIKEFELPIRWEGSDFTIALAKLYNHYCEKVRTNSLQSEYNKIKFTCDEILKAINTYLNGFPADAFNCFNVVMQELIKSPIKVYQKSGWDEPFYEDYNDPLNLFRVVSVQENSIYNRKRVFHVPYNLRQKISTNRYSIAGYPCLYLGTSLQLCCDEIRNNPFENYTIASRFQLLRNRSENNLTIKVIELGIKPQDFFKFEDNYRSFEERDVYLKKQYGKRKFNASLLNNPKVKASYLNWYPLIAACSFIRINKKDPFAVEYIIPQLLMQWVRKQTNNSNLVGIRYFSCASERISEMGFNYVFPVSGQKFKRMPYCKILAKSFKLTQPKYIYEFDSIENCENYLILDRSIDFIDK